MKAITRRVSVCSTERMKTVRRFQALTRLQGRNSKHIRASSVPTQLARSELPTSPRTSKAKLVVMPQAGQG